MNDRLLFSKVPAYRLATFRVLFAAVTVLCYIPHLIEQIRAYSQVSFHVPWIQGVPSWPGKSIFLLVPVLWLAGWAMLFGLRRRLAAAVLFTIGSYVFIIDVQHYSHNSSFHLVLMFLFIFADDGMDIRELFRTNEQDRVIASWKELLFLWQIGFVFFYATVEKIFSPFWGAKGSYFIYQTTHPTDWIRGLNPGLIQAAAPALSLAVSGAELFVALVYFFGIRKRWAVAVALALFAGLEVLERPYVFAWDLIASTVLFAPTCRRIVQLPEAKKWLASFDWLRVATFLPGPPKRFGARAAFCYFSGPVILLFLVADFFFPASGFGGGEVSSAVVPLLLLGAALVLWVLDLG